MKLLTTIVLCAVVTLSGCAGRQVVGTATGDFGKVELYASACKNEKVKDLVTAMGGEQYIPQMKEGQVTFSDEYIKSQGSEKVRQLCYLGKDGAEGVLIVDTEGTIGPLTLDQPLTLKK